MAKKKKTAKKTSRKTAAKKTATKNPDEGGLLAAFERGLRNALNTPPGKPGKAKKKA